MTRRVVVHYLDGRTMGGTERVTIGLLRRLAARWRPLLLVPEDADAGVHGAALEAGVEIIVTRRRADQTLPRCWALLRRLRPTIFHAQRAWPLDAEAWLLAARLCRVPGVVTTEHLFPARLPRRGVLRERLFDRIVSLRIAVSPHVAARVRAAFGTPARRLRVVLNGIETETYDLAADPALRDELRGGAPAVALTVAHLRVQKGIDVLLDAAVRLPGVAFAVAGEGPERGRLEAAIDARGLRHRVRLLGARADIPRLLGACDVFVLPSRLEGLPLAVLEAMAARRPVVATAVGGLPEVAADGEHALLVPSDDPAALAQAISRVLGDARSARAMAARAYEHVVERFTASRMADEISALYDALLDERGGEALR